MSAGLRPAVLALLECTVCGGTFSAASTLNSSNRSIVCNECGRVVPVVNGIPRFIDGPLDPVSRRTQASFGYEWTHFQDWRQSGETNFSDYFQGLDLPGLRACRVLDGGCGMGRHARQIARFAGEVAAVDFSGAIDQAARNTADVDNVDCVQADLRRLPFADGAFDFAYSLGVLHHLDDTEDALRQIVRKLRPGGRLRIYLYWKKHGWQGAILRAVTGVRVLTTRMPFPLLRIGCAFLSVVLFAMIVAPYRLLTIVGVRRHEHWPLFVYSKYPFNVLYNDQFDRFSAPLEKRYDAEEVEDLLARVGLEGVEVRACYGWLADGVKPGYGHDVGRVREANAADDSNTRC